MKNKSHNNLKPLLITTAHRGVFFGYGEPTDQKIIRIERARMCVYWSSECKGVMGLASTGPTKNCKIGPEVPAIILQEVTAVTEVSEVAAKEWEKGFWQ